MNRFLVRTFLLILAAGILSLPASANTITFDTAPPGPYFTGPVTEAGFTYSTLSGQLYVNVYGNPGQNMEGCYVCGTPGGGVLQIVPATAGTFTFDGLDFAAYDWTNSGTQTLDVEGYFGATLVGTDTYTLANTSTFSPSYANWTTETASVLAGDTLTSLDIVLNGGYDASGNPYNEAIDNVVLTTPVPEPCSLVLLACGALAIGVFRRHHPVSN